MVTKTQFGYIKPAPIEQEMRSSYLDYAMSVIVSRALPDARDGLKPVQRRILYAMHELGMRPNSSHKKSARLVGEVLGKWHPHGEMAVYDAMVRLAQDFSVRMPLVDGQGNFGSIDNDPAAAMRYTEARLSRVAEEMLVNLEQETVNFANNFDDTLQEPTVLPARLPNLLINGASGIAVGMATNIPPHNPSEICNAIVCLIDDSEATSEKLMRYVKGPDFPTGGTIMGREGIYNTYTTGRGQMVVRAKAEIEPMARGANRMQIIVSELPYQVNKSALMEKAASLVKSKMIDGITEMRDESDRDGMRIVFELRGGIQPQVVLNNLYKHTSMQNTFSANMLALVDGTPRMITLRTALQQYVKFREEVVTRRTQYELRRAKERAHILAGLRIAISHLDEVISLIRASDDAESARNELMARFDLDQPQAQAILDMQLRRLAALERERLEAEYQELQEEIRGLEELLADKGKVLSVVKEEVLTVKKKFGEKRRTDISGDAYNLSREELEAHERVLVTLSQGGYIKRIAASTYRKQHRAGKGVSGMITRDDDPVQHMLVVDTHDRLLFFTNKGRVFSNVVYELRADINRNTRGVPVVNVINAWDTEKVNALIGMSKNEPQYRYLILGTRQGKVKRISIDALLSVRPSGLRFMNLTGDDELVSVKLGKENDEVIFVSEKGMSIRFSINDVPTRQRAAGGVKGMSLRPGDKVVAMDVGNPESKLLVVSKQGFGKVTPLAEYRLQGRGGIGIGTYKITRNTGLVSAAEVVDDSTEVFVLSEKAQVMRTNLSEIRNLRGRITKGVRIFKPREGDSVSSVACVGDLQLGDKNTDLPDPVKSNSVNGNTSGRGNGQRSRNSTK